ncbi:MAG: acetyl-CoA carboxylase biotin carboxyl carrier protein [Alphaproteobacteria bacterium]|nr:acetyl-CoA carboxylase biotin carboxyl carrier protein [Alphaproteobacteria bacterium]
MTGETKKDKTKTAAAAKSENKSGLVSKGGLSKDVILELADIVNEKGLTEIEYETDSVRLRLCRNLGVVQQNVAVPAAVQTAAQPVASEAPALVQTADDYASHPGAVKAPMVGVVYRAPEPSAPLYCQEGDDVKEGDTLCLIEAMKTFNPVRAPRSGKIVKFLVNDGDPIEYDEVLCVIE